MHGLRIDLSIYPDEEALLAALRRGESDACTCMVKRFASPIYNAVLRIVGDSDEAEAIVQASFIKACDKFDSFEERSQLGTWLHRVATNEALMERRRRHNDNVPLGAVSEEQLTDVSQAAGVARGSVPDDPAAAALGQELRTHLEQAIATLPEGNRLVFVLRDLEGLSVKETAARLAISESAVKVRLHRARQQLRELLHGYLKETPCTRSSAESTTSTTSTTSAESTSC